MFGCVTLSKVHCVILYSLLISLLYCFRLETSVLLVSHFSLEHKPTLLMLASARAVTLSQKYHAFAHNAQKQAQLEYQKLIAQTRGLAKAQNQYLLAVTYRCGLDPNRALAANWFQEAAHNNHPLAATSLSELRDNKPCEGLASDF